jgi:hypothetical protein
MIQIILAVDFLFSLSNAFFDVAPLMSRDSMFVFTTPRPPSTDSLLSLPHTLSCTKFFFPLFLVRILKYLYI